MESGTEQQLTVVERERDQIWLIGEQLQHADGPEAVHAALEQAEIQLSNIADNQG